MRALLTTDDEGRRALRIVAGVLLGLAMVVIFIRQGTLAGWGDFALFVVLLLPCVFLYAAGLLGRLQAGDDPAWQGVYLVFGVLLVPLTLFQFLELINGDTSAPLNFAWIFLVSAGAAAVAGLVGGARFCFLLAGLFLIVSWLGLWDEILSEGLTGDLGTFRGLLMIIALLLVGAAIGLRLVFGEIGFARGAELITAAGIGVVVGAGLISFTGVESPLEPATSALTPATEAPEPDIEVDPVTGEVTVTGQLEGEQPSAKPSFFWDLVLFLGSVLLIAFGARFRGRGPVYVGAIGLGLFAFLVGLDLDSDSPEGTLLGWPLVLLLLGAAAFVVSVIPGLRLGSLGIDRLKPGGPSSVGGPPGAPPPPPPPAGAPPESSQRPPPGAPPPSA